MFINRDVIFNEGINEWEIMISQIQGHNNLWKMKVKFFKVEVSNYGA
jgi:hypothetical protein